jgi:cytochrome c2
VRQTKLKYATAAVVATLVFAALILSALRVAGTQRADQQQGATLFSEKGCGQCHYADSRDAKTGPGLKSLFSRESLPVSGGAVSEANIRDQLLTPYRNMPSFADRLSEEEIDHLIEYLKSL